MLTVLLAVITAVVVDAAPSPQAPSKGSGGSGMPKGGGSSGGLGGLIGDLGFSFVTSGNAVPNGPAPKGCSAYELLVARGTGEPGSFGLIVGDGLVSSVSRAISGARGYAVQYPASMNTSSMTIGVEDTINRLNNQHKLCPEQKFALVGYSQGAAVMHGVFGSGSRSTPGAQAPAPAKPKPTLEPSVLDKIKAVVMFGDPGFKGTTGMMGSFVPAFPPPLNTRLRENCAPGDPVCDPKGSGFQYHLMYITNPYQSDSSKFITAAFKGQPLPYAPTSASDPDWAANAAKNRPAATSSSGNGAPKGMGPPPSGGSPGGGQSPAKGPGSGTSKGAPKGPITEWTER